MGGTTVHAMGETTTDIKALDERRRQIEYLLSQQRKNKAKIEIEIPYEDYKPLIILTDINDSNFV